MGLLYGKRRDFGEQIQPLHIMRDCTEWRAFLAWRRGGFWGRASVLNRWDGELNWVELKRSARQVGIWVLNDTRFTWKGMRR